MTQFEKLGLIEPIRRALRAENYTDPTPIQAGAIPHLLAGRDLLGVAQTGTGKTAAFALPMLQLLSAAGAKPRPRAPRALVLVPTRELASQVADAFRTYGQFLKLSVAVIYGGVGQGTQVRSLAAGVDVLVATPGRLLDLMQQGHLQVTALEIFVLDEVDQMLDLGFIHDIKKLLRVLPKRRQNVFLSATMPDPIAKLADNILSNPAKVTVTPVASTVEKVEQAVHYVDKSRKIDVLCDVLLAPGMERALVFTRTKRGADRVARDLNRRGLAADAIHGNKSQNRRESTLSSFRTGRTRILVATDIAARGIDIDEISHVVNYELPNVPEVYVHRIGRTARAGASGMAISLCDETERSYLRDIERLIKMKLPNASRTEPRAPARSRERETESEPAGIRPAKTHAHRPHAMSSTPHREKVAPRHAPAAPRGPHRIDEEVERRPATRTHGVAAKAPVDAPHRRDAALSSSSPRRSLASASSTERRGGNARSHGRASPSSHDPAPVRSHGNAPVRSHAPAPDRSHGNAPARSHGHAPARAPMSPREGEPRRERSAPPSHRRPASSGTDRRSDEPRPLRPHLAKPQSHGAPASRRSDPGPRQGGRGSSARYR